MAPWNKAATLRAAVEDWKARGLVDAQTAERLEADIAERDGGWGFANVLILLAVLCLGLAALTFVAANWEDMPRLARMAMLVAGLWGFWAGAILLRLTGHPWYAEACILGACLLFGAALMLTSQMYHIQGEAEDAIWIWALGTLLAAAAARSAPALGLAVFLWALWPWFGEGPLSAVHDPRPAFLFWIALCAGVAWWLRSRFVAHLIALAIMSWVIGNALRLVADRALAEFGFLVLLAFAAIALLLWSEGRGKVLRGFERPALFYAAATAFGLLLAWYLANRFDGPNFEATGWGMAVDGIAVLICCAAALAGWRTAHPNSRDLIAAAVFAALAWASIRLIDSVPFFGEALLAAVSIWVMRMGWRLGARPLAVLGVAAFITVLGVIYVATVGTLLGTAGFYLLAGVVILAVGIWFARAAGRAGA